MSAWSLQVVHSAVCVATSETRNVSTIVQHQAMYPNISTGWVSSQHQPGTLVKNVQSQDLNPMRIHNIYSYFATTAFSLICSQSSHCVDNHGVMKMVSVNNHYIITLIWAMTRN